MSEKHYERRWLEAKSDIIKDAGPVVDFFINMHQQCEDIAEKHGVNSRNLRAWLLEQLPIHELNDGEEETVCEDECEDEE